jgi:hypothetical protein
MGIMKRPERRQHIGVPQATRETRTTSVTVRSPRDDVATASAVDDVPLWPRRRSTAVALLLLLLVQATSFFVVAQRSFFFHDDFGYFILAEQRHPLRYLLTPILAQYPAPGDRFLSLALHELAPMNFVAACLILLCFLAATTLVLRQLVGTLARSDHWWTVALVVPFALSITHVLPVSWWSAGIPVLPALFFTVVALSAFLRSYTDPVRVRFWIVVAALAIGAASTFYMKFLLIPFYLLGLRLLVLPRLIDVPGGVRSLWNEKARWIALAAPVFLFVAVFIAYLATGRLSWLELSSGPGYSRPYAEYFATAWFRAFVPASFMNARLVGSGPNVPAWLLIAGSQLILLVVVAATWRRSAIALRGWALFVLVFAMNVVMVGTQRLPGYGVDIAYWLRYYPEVTLFLPLALALGLRQGEERRPELAWERTGRGRATVGVLSCLYAIGFLIWAPGIVSDSPGARARAWYEELRSDVQLILLEGGNLPILDAQTPEYVIERWTAPVNRVSTVLSLAGFDIEFNVAAGRVYVVQGNGGLSQATFRPSSILVANGAPGEAITIAGSARTNALEMCLEKGMRLRYQPPANLAGERLAIKLFYAQGARGALSVGVETPDPDDSVYFELRHLQSEVELADLGTDDLRELTLQSVPGGRVCIDRMEIGSLVEQTS